jgi:hypothetical protein
MPGGIPHQYIPATPKPDEKEEEKKKPEIPLKQEN